jgi:hypothetical protein
MTSNWAIASVYSNQEMRFLKYLAERGVEAFVPLGKRMTKPKYKKRPVVITYVLFPGYVFINVPQGFGVLFLASSRFNFSFLLAADGKIAYMQEKEILSLRERHDIGDLFVDYEKKFVRNSFVKNQLVCWRDGINFSLGFISRNTRGKLHAYVKTAGNNELKIPVALLSLL